MWIISVARVPENFSVSWHITSQLEAVGRHSLLMSLPFKYYDYHELYSKTP